MIERIIAKSNDDQELTAEEVAALFEVPLFSPEAGLILSAARTKSARAAGGRAEVHGQIGVNIAPCSRNCRFCAFAAENEVFTESVELSVEEVVERTQQFFDAGANAVFLMSTAHYSFGRFVELSTEVRRAVGAEPVLVANVGDFDQKGARRLVDAGFDGVYHAVRMGEGRDTAIPVEKRLKTFRAATEAGLTLGTCVEPVGPEHDTAELVDKTLITRDARPAYSGAMRRIPIPDTKLGELGIVSEARMAHIVAVTRLALGCEIPGHCTHEPSTLGALAGAALLWAETGANPRDTAEETEGQRGISVDDCRRMLNEAEWSVLDGPSRFYRG
jgi:biotin synthase